MRLHVYFCELLFHRERSCLFWAARDICSTHPHIRSNWIENIIFAERHKMFFRSCLSQEVQPSCSCACYICPSLITIWNYNESVKRLNSIWGRLRKQMTTLWWIVLNCFQAGTILVEIYLCCWMFTADIWDDVSKSRVSKLIICPAAQQEKVNSLKGNIPSWKRCV